MSCELKAVSYEWHNGGRPTPFRDPRELGSWGARGRSPLSKLPHKNFISNGAFSRGFAATGAFVCLEVQGPWGVGVIELER